MPLREGQPYQPNLVPPPLHSEQKVWVNRFTGALFSSYEEYLKQLATYRQKLWGCKHTGRENLSYEEALASEAKCQSMLDQFPKCYEEPVTRLLHHATLKVEDLCQWLLAHFKERFVVGERVTGMRDGSEAACRVIGPVEGANPEHSGLTTAQAMSSAAAMLPPDPEDEYQVEWLADKTSGVVKRGDLFRKRMPLTRAVLKAWLPLAAEAEPVTGVKGIPCIWRANAAMCERFGLSAETPLALKERIERAQQRREQQSKRTSLADQDAMMRSEALSDDEDAEDDDSLPDRTTELKAKISALGASPTAGVLKELLTADQSEGKLVIPVEPLEKSRARFEPGTVKRVLFDTLEAAGDKGQNIAALVEAVQASGVKTWEGTRSANSSVAATCTHDSAFMRIGPGQFTLRAFRQETMQITTSAASVRAGSEEAEGSGRSPYLEHNNFKCPKCLRTHHQENSPLVLCDSCPGSFHLSCLGLTFEELPEEDWQCPKCQDRKTSTGRRLNSYARNSDIYERTPYTEAEREERLVLRHLSRADREKRKDQEKTDKERLRDENRSLREKAKEAARWAALHPTDDLEILDDEEEALAAAETQAQVAAEEAIRVARRAQAKADGSLDDRLARLQRRAKGAAERAAALRLVIQGPQPVTPGVQTDTARTALYDALAIVDFITIFGASFEAAPLTLLEVQQAASFPLDTDHLSHLYIALLRCLLIEAMAMEGVVRSRAKRWGRVIDESTWAEILRRYLLASRAGLAVPKDLDSLALDPDTAHMDDNTACMVGAKLLMDVPYYKLSAGVHLRLLVALCNDVSECTTLRNEITARVDEMIQLQTEFRQKQIEDRKRLKEEAVKVAVQGTPEQTPAAEGAAQEEPPTGTVEKASMEGKDGSEEKDAALAESQQGEQPDLEMSGATQPKQEAQPDGSVREQPGNESAEVKEEAEEDLTANPVPPSFELPEELKEYKGSKRDRKELQAWKARRSEEMERLAKEKGAWERQQKERRKKRQKLAEAKKAEVGQQQAAAAAQEKDYEEEMRGREAALDDAMDARAIRGEPLGQDRHFRRYWWYPGEQSVVFVEEPDGSSVGILEGPEELDNLMERLNQNGLREKVLYQSLAKRRDTIQSTLGYHAVNLDVNDAARPLPDQDIDALARDVDKAAVAASVKKMTEFLDQLDSIPAAPVTASVEDWKARLKLLQSKEELATAVLDLEADVNGLGSGLPPGADDASLAGFGKQRKSAASTAVLEARASRELPSSAEPEQPAASQLPNGRADPPAEQPSTLTSVFAQLPLPEADTRTLQEGSLDPPAVELQSPAEAVHSLEQPVSADLADPQIPDPAAVSPAQEGAVLMGNGAAATEQPNEQTGKGSVKGKAEPGMTADEAARQQERAEQQNGLAEDSHYAPSSSAVDPLAEKALSEKQARHVETDAQKPPAETAEGKAEALHDTRAEPASNSFDASLSASNSVERLFKDEDYHLPHDYIDPPDELDASDTEGSKSRRGGTLWRSARERKVWLKDARRALHSKDASCAAYLAAVLVDRAQPLVRSLQRATKRAEKEAAEYEALEAAAAAPVGPSSAEGTPAPQLKAEVGKPAKTSVKTGGKSEKSGVKAEGSQAKARKGKRSSDLQPKGSGRSSEGPPSKKPRTFTKQAADVNGEAQATAEPTLPSPDGSAEPRKRSDRWSYTCQTCGEEGDLLCCEAPDCPIAQHVACAGLDDVPEGDWYCALHRNKPSLKRKRSRSAAKDTAASAAPSAEPQAATAKRAAGGGKGSRAKAAAGEGSAAATIENGVVTKKVTARKRKR